jgi:adenine-specific DNA-methyltransferase
VAVGAGWNAGAGLNAVDHLRLEANSHLDPERKAKFGQFMTPASVARFMASLFSNVTGPVNLLDAGAGIGSLTAAFIGQWGPGEVSVSAYEIDTTLSSYLRETFDGFGDTIQATISRQDFIQDAVYRIKLGTKGRGFTHAILNPPYKRSTAIRPIAPCYGWPASKP